MSVAAIVSAVCIESLLPLEWQPKSNLTQGNIELQKQGNLALLRALSSIEVTTPERDAHAEAIEKSIERVESKLDVLLLLVARMASGSIVLPAEKPVTLDTRHLAWDESGSLPTVGSALLVNLYLNPRLPQPLQLVVKVESIAGTQVVAVLEPLGDDLEEWLTRTIFRYHRRALQARKSAQQA
jgi:hypothetical protein